MTLNWYWPKAQMKAVFSLLSASMLTCQYPELRSSVVKILAPLKESMISCIVGSGYASSSVTEFNFRMSTQNQGSTPVFFGIRTTGAAQAEDDGSMMSSDNVLSISLFIASSFTGET